jgi:hypothetical protein
MIGTQPVENKKPGFIGYLLVTIVFLILLFIGWFVYSNYSALKEETLFKSQSPALVIASENLITLTDQGVSNTDFAGLLGEVKAQYNSIHAWPLKNTDANYEFVQAIEGWTLALDVWNLKTEQNSEYGYQTVVDLERLSAYLGIAKSKFEFFTASDMVRELLFNAKEHAAKGKQLLGY